MLIINGALSWTPHTGFYICPCACGGGNCECILLVTESSQIERRVVSWNKNGELHMKVDVI